MKRSSKKAYLKKINELRYNEVALTLQLLLCAHQGRWEVVRDTAQTEWWIFYSRARGRTDHGCCGPEKGHKKLNPTITFHSKPSAYQ